MPDPTKRVRFWQRREVIGPLLTLLSYSPELINSLVASDLLPEHTLVARIAAPLGIILAMFGLRRGMKDKNLYEMENGEKLPEGLKKTVEKVKEITGSVVYKLKQ
jgi:hypothetical protein